MSSANGSIVVCDSGTTAIWYARDLVFREGMMGSVSGGLATMGCAVPYALAAKMAHPTRPVIAVLGDGAMQMIGMNGLITVSRYWREWKDKRFVVMVLNNADLNMVTWEQRGTGRPVVGDRPGQSHALHGDPQQPAPP